MISILMPIYNGVEFLRESLASVVSQTNQDWELLIGINGHPPMSEVYRGVAQYNSPKIRVFDLPAVHGKSQALNALVRYTKGDFLCLLDVDDIWLETKLAAQVGYMDEFDVVGTHAQYFGDRMDQPAIPLGVLDSTFFRT